MRFCFRHAPFPLVYTHYVSPSFFQLTHYTLFSFFCSLSFTYFLPSSTSSVSPFLPVLSISLLSILAFMLFFLPHIWVIPSSPSLLILTPVTSIFNSCSSASPFLVTLHPLPLQNHPFTPFPFSLSLPSPLPLYLNCPPSATTTTNLTHLSSKASPKKK